ncbi:MAG TPA: hypothetical protein VHD62_09105 [Opitutaceae bacterium]|nr:hypothetical protein [Opitutaceae bacterium]
MLCPFLIGVACWWSMAALAIYDVAPVPERLIAWALFAGVIAGIALDCACLRHWIARFYGAGWAALIPLYLACSVVAVASCMGLPLGNLALGTLAGIYAGRRERHRSAAAPDPGRLTRHVALFTATVTGLESFAIGLLALREHKSLQLMAGITGTSEATLGGVVGSGIIAILSFIVAAFQFVCTRTAARLAAGRSVKSQARS